MLLQRLKYRVGVHFVSKSSGCAFLLHQPSVMEICFQSLFSRTNLDFCFIVGFLPIFGTKKKRLQVELLPWFLHKTDVSRISYRITEIELTVTFILHILLQWSYDLLIKTIIGLLGGFLLCNSMIFQLNFENRGKKLWKSIENVQKSPMFYKKVYNYRAHRRQADQ